MFLCEDRETASAKCVRVFVEQFVELFIIKLRCLSYAAMSAQHVLSRLHAVYCEAAKTVRMCTYNTEIVASECLV